MPHIRRPADPTIGRYDALTADVWCLRRVIMDAARERCDALQICTNVPQEIWLWPNVGYGWGVEQREGYTLACNVLHYMLPIESTVTCDDWHVPLPCHPMALRLALSFQEQFLAPLPPAGGPLHGHTLRAWLADALHSYRRRGLDLRDLEPTQLYPAYP